MFLLLLCVSGALCYRYPGYHASAQHYVPSQNWNSSPTYIRNANGSNNHGYQAANSESNSGYSWRQGFDWSKSNGNNYDPSQTVNGQDDTYKQRQSVKGQNNAYKLSQSRNGQDNYNRSQVGNDRNTTCGPSQSGNGQNSTNEPSQTTNSLENISDRSQKDGLESTFNSSQIGNSRDGSNTSNTTIPGTIWKPFSLPGSKDHDTSTMTPGNMSEPVSTSVPMTTFSPPRPPPTYLPPPQRTPPPTRRPPPTSRPQPPPSTRPPPPNSGPATMSEPVPTLREFYAPSLQYHVGLYTKTFTPYMQVCGGSLVKADVVLSAAHCFWNDDVGLLRPALFAVAAGKLLRPWEIPRETFAQRTDVKDVKIPSRFQGGRTSFQEDIAVVITTRPFDFAPGVKPVCISFDLELDRRQLKSGSMGTIAGWGLTQPNGLPSQRLNFLKLPYVDIDDCIRKAETSFVKYITSDKICAGDQKTGRALCRGDSGGGLVYYTDTVPYLRGIASVAQRDANECNAYAIASFTHVLAHRTFLVDHVPDIAEGCEVLYEDDTSVSTQNYTQRSLLVQNAKSTDKLNPSDIDKIFNNNGIQKGAMMQDQEKNEQALEQKSGGSELYVTPTSTRQSQNEQNAKLEQMKMKMNLSGTLEQKSRELDLDTARRKPMYDMMTRQSLNVLSTEQQMKENVARNQTTLVIPQGQSTFRSIGGGLGREMEATVVTSMSQQTKLVTMTVGRGERGVVTVPVEDASSFVCDCFCRN